MAPPSIESEGFAAAPGLRPARASGRARLLPSSFPLPLLLPLLLYLLSPPAFAQKHPAKPIDLNRATLPQLEELPGIGPSMARRILEFREKSGPFRRVEDLLAIRGIGQKRFEQLRPYVYVSPPAPAPKPQSPPRTRKRGALSSPARR